MTRRPRRAAATPSRDPHLAVAYLRVSTEEQHLGPEAQRAAIEAWATQSGVTIDAWHTDQGVSGGAEVADRPALTEALSTLRAGTHGVLVVAKRDRLARDVVIAGWIDREAERLGAAVVAADGAGNERTPQGEFLRTVLDGAAQLERRLISRRTKDALDVKRDRGERTGSVPRGYRLAPDGVALEVCPDEVATLRRAHELRRAGRSIRQIGRDLAAEQRMTRTGRPYSVRGVQELLAVDLHTITDRRPTTTDGGTDHDRHTDATRRL